MREDAINSHLQDIEYRNRYYTPDVVIFAFLSQVMGEDQSCQMAVAQIAIYFLKKGIDAPSANTAAYCKARAKLPETVLSGLTRGSAEELEEEALPRWMWRDKHVKLVDGSTISMPDTAANQKEYPQPSSQKDGLGFPIMRVVAVISLATGAVLDFAMGPYSGKKTGEHALLRQLLSAFNEGDVALGDCYYASFFLIAALLEAKVDLVFPMHASRGCNFRCGQHLGKRDHLIYWSKPSRPSWMSQEEYNNFPDQILVRETAVPTNLKGFRSKTRILVSTFLDSQNVRPEDLSLLYDARWFVEISLKAIKETMRMDVLRTKTPEMIRKEVWAHLLAYNLIRKIMGQAAGRYSKNPRELSFKLALQFVLSWRQAGCTLDIEIFYNGLLQAIIYKKVANRPGRSEPRKIKRRPKSFPRLQKPRNCYNKKAA